MLENLLIIGLKELILLKCTPDYRNPVYFLMKTRLRGYHMTGVQYIPLYSIQIAQKIESDELWRLECTLDYRSPRSSNENDDFCDSDTRRRRPLSARRNAASRKSNNSSTRWGLVMARVSFRAFQEHKNYVMAQDTADRLMEKMNIQKRQLDEAEGVAMANIQRVRRCGQRFATKSPSNAGLLCTPNFVSDVLFCA